MWPKCELALCRRRGDRYLPSCSHLRRGPAPFVNLPEAERESWGTGLIAEAMKKCIWVRPELVARFEYVKWTEGGHLRHAKFAGLRADKDARSVTKELAFRP